MYKKIPKTHFVGQTIEVLTSCLSTNTCIASKLQKGQLKNGEVILTDHQTQGRGQRGNVWESEPGKNLTFSLGVFDLDLPVQEQFRLHFITALAIVKTINENTLAYATIKWPNDIYIGDKKVAGILIENNLRKNEIYSSVIGVGFNINQIKFQHPRATSLAIETKKEHFQEEILVSFLENFEHYLLRKEDKIELERLYHQYMYRLGVLAHYEDEQGEFCGTILGVDPNGLLQVQRGTQRKLYGFKEIKYLFTAC